jgi:uncharacterized protein YjbJ (UPF0337 family)
MAWISLPLLLDTRATPNAQHNPSQRKERVMNWDQFEGKWKQMKGRVKEKWGQLTDDELDQIGGKRDRLAGLLQEKYGIAKDEAERELESFRQGLGA